MELNDILFGIIGFLSGGTTIFLIFFRNINRLSILVGQHGIKIDNNKEDCKEAVTIHGKLLDLVTKLVNQNTILIQRKLAES